MKNEKMLKALGSISDELIEEANIQNLHTTPNPNTTESRKPLSSGKILRFGLAAVLIAGLLGVTALAVEQFRLSEQDHGEHIACLEARKHFAWYLRGVAHSSYYKNQITSLNTMEDIYRVARDVVRDLK